MKPALHALAVFLVAMCTTYHPDAEASFSVTIHDDVAGIVVTDVVDELFLVDQTSGAILMRMWANG